MRTKKSPSIDKRIAGRVPTEGGRTRTVCRRSPCATMVVVGEQQRSLRAKGRMYGLDRRGIRFDPRRSHRRRIDRVQHTELPRYVQTLNPIEPDRPVVSASPGESLGPSVRPGGFVKKMWGSRVTIGGGPSPHDPRSAGFVVQRLNIEHDHPQPLQNHHPTTANRYPFR